MFITIAWAIFYRAIYFFDGNSFEFSGQTPRLHDFLYFSVVTITTLGYGDIMPISFPARILSLIEVMLGVFFVAVYLSYILTNQNKKSIHK
ncbi:MAG: potassium channel family protein [Candidatus Hodarchaeales archaeon]|jgi:uncharacterized membrane protein